MSVLHSLPSNNIPVKVITKTSSNDEKRSMALALENTVIVTDAMTVSGLERRIVIGLDKGAKVSKGIGGDERLYGMSRSTSQLVWLDGGALSRR
jgi:hypothetical protein